MMFHGDELIRRDSEFNDRVFEAGLYNYWIYFAMHLHKWISLKIAIVQRLDGNYSFNLYHLQNASYLLLEFWCLGAFCLLIELFMEMCLFEPL
jgi:hypothetical protein